MKGIGNSFGLIVNSESSPNTTAMDSLFKNSFFYRYRYL